MSWRDVCGVVPFFVMGAGLGLLTLWMEKHHVGAAGEEWAFSFVDRILIAGRSLWFYAGKLLWPRELAFIYPRWHIDSSVWWQYLFPLAAVAAIVTLWLLRKRLGKAPLVAALYFTGTLIPALGFFNVFPMRYSFVADHWQYLASIGLVVLCVGAIATYIRRVGPAKRYTVYAALLVILGILTWRQGHIYGNLETLWRDTLAKNPHCWMAHNNLGNVLLRQGKIKEAAGHYREALRIKPDFEMAHYNLAGVLANQGKSTEAISHYTEALRIKPDYSNAHCNLGVALAVQGKTKEAIAHFAEALRIKPDNARVHNNLGLVLADGGKFTEAIVHYREALRIKPDFATVRYNLGNLMVRQGKIKEAAVHYRKALRIKPDYADAHCNLGNVLIQQGKIEEAIAHYSEVLRIRPKFAEVHYKLGMAFLVRKDKDSALQEYEILKGLDEYLANKLLGSLD